MDVDDVREDHQASHKENWMMFINFGEKQLFNNYFPKRHDKSHDDDYMEQKRE